MIEERIPCNQRRTVLVKNVANFSAGKFAVSQGQMIKYNKTKEQEFAIVN